MPRLGQSSEGSSSTRDASRATAEPMSLGVFFELFKKSFEKLEHCVKEQYQREDQRFNEIIDRMDRCLMEQNATSVEMKKGL